MRIPILKEKRNWAEEFFKFSNILVIGIAESTVYIEAKGLDADFLQSLCSLEEDPRQDYA